MFFIPQAKGNKPDPPDDEDFADAKVDRGISKATLDHVVAHFGPGAHHHLNAASNQFRVDLVDDDEGLAAYRMGVGLTPVTAGVPGVVTIDQLRERAGFIETGAFDLRIILTEEPKGGLTTDLILVEGGGKATKVTKGATLKGATGSQGLPPGRTSELAFEMASFTPMTGPPVNASTPVVLPEATGRDNKYYQYFVTIEPDPGVDGNLVVSLKQFADNVLPVGKEYLPLTPEQRRAVTLDPATAETVRDARVANETLTVRVSTGADTTSVGVLATAAYAARDQGLSGSCERESPLLRSL